MNIWTRQRNLKDHEAGLLTNLRQNKTGLLAELDNDDWYAAAVSAGEIMADAIRMQEVERELEDVDALVEGYKKIQEGMERLAGQK